MSVKEELHRALILAAMKPKKFGICSHVLENVRVGWQWKCETHMRRLMRQWPKFSGSCSYPVPHPTEHPEHAYDIACSEQRWDPDTEYGANRLELFEFLLMETGTK